MLVKTAKPLFESPVFAVGDKVKSTLYGKGEVIELEPYGVKRHMMVHFEQATLDKPNGFNKLCSCFCVTHIRKKRKKKPKDVKPDSE